MVWGLPSPSAVDEGLVVSDVEMLTGNVVGSAWRKTISLGSGDDGMSTCCTRGVMMEHHVTWLKVVLFDANMFACLDARELGVL